MKTTKIGKYTVTVELDRIDNPIKYYDAVLSLNDKTIKVCSGCIGEQSGLFWGTYLEKIAKRLTVLDSTLEKVSTMDEIEFIQAWRNELL